MPELPLTDRDAAALEAAERPLKFVEAPQRVRRRDMVGRLALLAADTVAVVAAYWVVTVLPFSELIFTGWFLAFPPAFALLAKMAGLYDRDPYVLHKTTLEEAPKLVAVAAIFALAVEGLQAFIYTGGSHPLPLWFILTCALVLARAGGRFLAVRVTTTERVLVVGSAGAAAVVRRKLAADASLNAAVVGRVSLHGGPASEPPDKLLGTVEGLPGLLERHSVERVIVAPTHEGGEDVVDVVRLATECGVRVAVLPGLLEVIGTSVEFDDLGGHALLGVRGFGLSPSSRLLKRGFDLAVGGCLTVALAPLLVALAVAIRMGSPGPVLFRQARIGRDGKEFQVLKFRTMVDDADQRKHEVLGLNEAAAGLFKIADDPRTTRVGRHLRRRSLDELPQLLNVLKGDMSLVGPRPLIPDEVRFFSGWQRRRYQVAPGITGPWQILGSSRIPISDMVAIDYLYCTNWSLWLDAKILVRTIPYVLSRNSPEHRIRAER